MKIVIFSDSHGDAGTMCSVIDKEMPDMIIYLGDGIADAKQLNEKYPDIQMIKNLGNMDSEKKDEELIKFAEICGKRFVMTHGHTFINYTFNDKINAYQLTDESRTTCRINIQKFMADNNADVFLHGHTHEPYLHRILMQEKVCWIMNPGSIRRMDDGLVKPTYGMLKIDENGTMEWQIAEVE